MLCMVFFDDIGCFDDVRKFIIKQVEDFVEEICVFFIDKVLCIGGYFGLNFGVVELMIVLYWVFDYFMILLFLILVIRVMFIRFLLGV